MDELDAKIQALESERANDRLIIDMLCEEIRRLKLGARNGHPNDDLLPNSDIPPAPIRLVGHPRFQPAATDVGAAASVRLSEILRMWREDMRPAVKNVSRVSRSVRRFIDLCGDKAANDYTKRDVRDYLREVRRLPKWLPARFYMKPIQAALRYADENPGAATLAPSTVKAHLKDLQMMFNWAITVDMCAGNPTNNLRVVDDRNMSELRVAFDEADLKRIFEQAPLYRGCLGAYRRKVSGDMIIKDSLFWFPLFALFTGARLGEIAAATLDDFKEDGGIYYLDIHAAGDNRHLKSQSADRPIPIHHELIKMGFLDFLREQRGDGQVTAFLRIAGQRDIRCKTGWSQSWRRFQGSVGIRDRRKVFHSFRHTFKRACRDCGIEEEVHDTLTGHRPYWSGRRYGQGASLKTLDDAIQKVRFGSLNLTHLYEQPSA